MAWYAVGDEGFFRDERVAPTSKKDAGAIGKN
jgi:hypothetical protein